MGQKSEKAEKRISGLLADLKTVGKNRCQLVGRNHFELRIGAVAWLFVASPSAKLCRMTEAVALHVVVGDFQYQLGAQWFP